jgi:hypothetical protein
MKACVTRGYLALDGDGRDAGRDFESGHAYAEFMVSELGLDPSPPPWPFLSRHVGDEVLLNPLGFGEVGKGLPLSAAHLFAREVALSFPDHVFIFPTIDSIGRDRDLVVPAPSNLRVPRFDYGEPALLYRYLSARCIVTAEGGGYHIARAASVPALLVASCQWLTQVAHALPPPPHDRVVFDKDHLDLPAILGEVSEWLSRALS